MKGTQVRGRVALLLAVVVGVLLGAIFGQAGTGKAASSAVPKNKTLPTMSGTAVVGETLIAVRGTWSGTPRSFGFAWSRCNSAGSACLAIPGATAKIYTVTNADVGSTLRLTVTARNASGAASATSAATTVVPPSGCPTGTGTIQITQLAPPERIEIVGAKVVGRVTHATRSLHLRLAVTACGGRAVQGATVFASAIPYNQFGAVEGTTAADGTVTLDESRRRGFPASAHQHLLAVFVRASAPGQSVLDGVSSSRVVAFPVF